MVLIELAHMNKVPALERGLAPTKKPKHNLGSTGNENWCHRYWANNQKCPQRSRKKLGQFLELLYPEATLKGREMEESNIIWKREA